MYIICIENTGKRGSQHGKVDKMKNVFCTILSKFRVYQGIALYRSLLHNAKEFRMYILCIDEDSYSICSKMNLQNAVLIREVDLGNEKLFHKRYERELNEFCWTVKPFLVEYIFEQCAPNDYVTYVDSDICFFNNPTPIYLDHTGCDVLLSEHNYSINYRSVENVCGKYNSGFIIFKNEENARHIVKWWQDRCMEWCYDRTEADKFGDQKYLDFVPVIFKKVCSIITAGVNIGPWNEAQYNYRLEGGVIHVNKDRLICYHFSGFRIVGKNSIALIGGSKNTKRMLQVPYILVIKGVIEDVEKVAPNFEGFSLEERFVESASFLDI